MSSPISCCVQSTLCFCSAAEEKMREGMLPILAIKKNMIILLMTMVTVHETSITMILATILSINSQPKISGTKWPQQFFGAISYDA